MIKLNIFNAPDTSDRLYIHIMHVELFCKLKYLKRLNRKVEKSKIEIDNVMVANYCHEGTNYKVALAFTR